MKSKLIVYSCVTSGYDQVHDTLFQGHVEPGVRLVRIARPRVHHTCAAESNETSTGDFDSGGVVVADTYFGKQFKFKFLRLVR